MANLIVIVFDEQDEAARVRETLKSIENIGHLSLNDSAVVEKDENGKVHVKNQFDRGVKVGALSGGLIGLLIGGIFFPLAGLLMGTLGGALVGSAAKMGISKSFVKQVSEELQPSSSALFVLVREADPALALAALREYDGKVYHTTLDPEGEEQIRRAVEKHNSAE